MSDTIKLTANMQEVDANNDLITEKDFTQVTSYSFALREYFTTPDTSPGGGYVTINISPITTGKFLRLASDEYLNVKLNGGSQVFANTKLVLVNCDITGVAIENKSGSTANIELELYGV